MRTTAVVTTSFSSYSLPVATVLSAILFFFSTGFYNNWLLTWLAPLPVCLYALQSPAKKTAMAAFLAYTSGTMNQFGYLPLPVFAATTTLSALAFTGNILLFRALTRAKQQTMAPFAFAAGWTAYEFIHSLTSSMGTFDSLAYTQVFNLPVLQVASLTGIWGITFLLMLLPSSIAIFWRYRQNRRTCQLPLLLTGGLLTVILLFGAFRLYWVPPATANLTVGLAAAPTTREELHSQDTAIITAALRRYMSSVDRLADAGAQVVLLPEKLASLTPAAHATGTAILSETALRSKITLIAGVSTEEGRLYNTAVVLAPDGSQLQSYHKQHLLPAYESRYTPGKNLTLLNIGTANKAGLAICKDMDFIQPASDYSRQGVGVLFVPALDFHDDGWLHARIATVRGVEGNYSVARAAQWGLLTVSDSCGRVLGIQATDTDTGEANLLCKIPLGTGHSFYSVTGDWLAWVSLLLTILAVTRLIWKNYR